ncbi:MAG: response regulator [Lachnospiraceae bacterium]|nr:response regulator [Lachnospiraceae bacterium]
MSKIYVCDDDPVILMMVSRILGKTHEIMTSQTRDGLLELLAAGKPDIILLDFLMPEGDGLEFISILREKGYYPEIPVVIVTGDRDLSLEAKCMNEGVGDFIQKPFVPDVLMNRVQQVIDRINS